MQAFEAVDKDDNEELSDQSEVAPVELTLGQKQRVAKLIEDLYPEEDVVRPETVVAFGEDLFPAIASTVNLSELPFAKYNSYAEIYSAMDKAERDKLMSWLANLDKVTKSNDVASTLLTLLASDEYRELLHLVDSTFGKDSGNTDDVLDLVKYLKEQEK